MTLLNLNERRSGGGSSEDRPVLPTDIYRMKIIEAKLEDDTFNPNKDGSFPQKIALTWETTILTEEQQEAADEAEQEWLGVRIWTRLNPYYNTVKAGGPSKFMAFIDDLRSQGLLADFDPEAFDIESLVGIEQKCSVECYKKTMGPNAGKPGNKINAFSPVRTKKGGKTINTNTAQDTPVLTPTPEAVAAARPVGRNVPVPVSDDEIPF